MFAFSIFEGNNVERETKLFVHILIFREHEQIKLSFFGQIPVTVVLFSAVVLYLR